MDTDLHLRRPVPTEAAYDPHADGAARASAIIGSDEFVERVLRAMTIGVRRAVEENAALQSQSPNRKP
ncbi:MAG TPA: hypothetical protein VME47_16430 [Acetobacteraceae bacterium]|nr:hypothetical protein [Acetobacteraceae bacterium]